MPAVTVDNSLALPRLPRLSPEASVARPVELVVTAHEQMEGAGISIRRPFPGELPLAAADPFLLLDQVPASSTTSYPPNGPSLKVGRCTWSSCG